MAYNNVISRGKAQALIPEDVADSVITKVTQESAALTMFRRVPVANTQLRIPILSALPTAYFVTADTGLKQTTEAAWSNKFLNIEELACIVPFPENVLDDTSYDVWGELKPLIEEAVGRTIDASIYFGTSAPSSFPTNILTATTNAGNTVIEGSTQANGGFQNDLDLGIAVVEADGFDISGYVAARSMKAKLRQARATTGQRLDNFNNSNISPSMTDYLGDPIAYPMRGLFPSGGAAGTNVRTFMGDWSQFVFGLRKDLTYQLFTEGVIQDNTGAIVYNLMQQDMVALRVTLRFGWQVANIINFDNPVDASRYPVAALLY